MGEVELCLEQQSRVTPGAITEDARAESRVRNRDLENAWSRFSSRQNDYMK